MNIKQTELVLTKLEKYTSEDVFFFTKKNGKSNDVELFLLFVNHRSVLLRRDKETNLLKLVFIAGICCGTNHKVLFLSI